MGLILLKRMLLLLLSVTSVYILFGNIMVDSDEESVRHFPYTIAGTNIVLESIKDHDGATAVFYNNDDRIVESVFIELTVDTGKLVFETTMLPAKERIVLKERDGKALNNARFLYGTGYYKPGNSVLRCDYMSINGRELMIENVSYSFEFLEVYLKPWNDQEQVYLGDKTIKIVIRNLVCKDVVSVKLPASNYKVVYYISKIAAE